MIDADADQIASAEVILSIVPPAEALALARRLAPALARGPKGTVYVDCNAIDVRTVQRVAETVGAGPARFVDGAIIGAPPVPGRPGPVLFLAGPAAPDLLWLETFGLELRLLEGPIGAASALKMAYAGINKGLTGLAAAMVLAAARAGASRALRQELEHSQPQLLQRFTRALPDMYPKAHRWADEMREIAAFVAEDSAAARVYAALGDLYERLAADDRAGRTEIGLIEAFLNLPPG